MKFNFIFKGLRNWLSLRNITSYKGVCGIDDCDFMTGKEVWILKTYKYLQKSQLDITISEEIDPNSINVTHRDDYYSSMSINNFVVCIRADRDPAFTAEVEILQNTLFKNSLNRYFIPHWPQGGIIKRDSHRNGIRQLSYFGKEYYVSNMLKSRKFQEFCEINGLTFKIFENNWTDYSTTDIVIAIRDGFPFYCDCKPPSKLVNAWFAGVPAIINPEYGYKDVISDVLDAIFVNTLDDLLYVIKKMIDSPEIYDKMVANGTCKASNFTCDKIALQWEEILNRIANSNFQVWKCKHSLFKKIAFIMSLIHEKVWGIQVAQYPNSFLRNIKSYIRIFISCPIVFMKHLVFSLKFRFKTTRKKNCNSAD